MDIKTVIPGHGPVGTPKGLNALIDYVRTSQNLVEEGTAAGKSRKEIIDTATHTPDANRAFDRYFAANMRFACDLIIQERAMGE